MASKARRTPPEEQRQHERPMAFKQRMFRLSATLYQKADIAGGYGEVDRAETLRARARGCEECAR